MARIVHALSFASRLSARPKCIPVSRPRATAKKLGVRYEAGLAKALGAAAKRGVWWEFVDSNGHGYCQTDVLVEQQGRTLVLESKLTWTPEGHEQLERLYLPVVREALGGQVLGVLVTRRVLPETHRAGAVISLTLREAVIEASAGRRSVLLWLGKNPAALALPGWPAPAAQKIPTEGALIWSN